MGAGAGDRHLHDLLGEVGRRVVGGLVRGGDAERGAVVVGAVVQTDQPGARDVHHPGERSRCRPGPSTACGVSICSSRSTATPCAASSASRTGRNAATCSTSVTLGSVTTARPPPGARRGTGRGDRTPRCRVGPSSDLAADPDRRRRGAGAHGRRPRPRPRAARRRPRRPARRGSRPRRRPAGPRSARWPAWPAPGAAPPRPAPGPARGRAGRARRARPSAASPTRAPARGRRRRRARSRCAPAAAPATRPGYRGQPERRRPASAAGPAPA